jgi:Bacterial Ig-like domain
VPRRSVAALLVLGQLTLWLPGCVSVRATGSRESGEAAGGVAVQVFADDAGRRARRPGPQGVLGELERKEDGRWKPVFRSLDPTWTVAGLPAATYRVRFPARLDEAGNVVRLRDEGTELKVRDGRITEAEAILDHVSPALVVVGVVTVVVAAVLLAQYLENHDLPHPPPPPPELVNAIFYVSLDVAATPGWSGVADRLPPAVTSTFPAAGAVVAARRPRLIFAISEPLKPEELEAKGVTVLGEASGLVPGQVSYDSEHWWVVWEPGGDLSTGDTFHATLAAGAVEDLAGNELAKPVSFSFRTAR